jgi:hypothetical protein
MTAVLALLSCLGMGAPPENTSGRWELLYTVPTRAQWLASVWLGDDGTWFAGGKGLLVSGRDKKAQTTDLPGDVVYAFGEDASGRVVAVGLRASVWERDGGSFRRVHGTSAPAPRGKAAYRDLLYGIGYLDPSAPDRLLAYGPNDLIVSRDGPNSGWQPTRDAALASRTLVGRRTTPTSREVARGVRRHGLQGDERWGGLLRVVRADAAAVVPA